MKTAVVFAAYINDARYFAMFEKNMELFLSEMHDSKFYVGINACKHQLEIIRYFKMHKLDFKYAITDARLTLPTDASAYQTALSLMQKDNEKFDLIWFSHTKGSNSQQYNDLVAQLIELYLKKENVAKHFLAHPKCGLYATSGVVYPKVRPFINRYATFRYPPLLLSPLYSCYAIRGKLVRNFLTKCNDIFFTEKLPNGHFFEFDFPQITFQQGYVPYVQQIVQVHHAELQTIKSTPQSYQGVLDKWMDQNKL